MSSGIADRCDWFLSRCGSSLRKDAFHPPRKRSTHGNHSKSDAAKAAQHADNQRHRDWRPGAGDDGAMAEKFNALIDGGVAYFGGNIQVGAAGSSAFGGGSVLQLSTVNQIEQVNGVAAAFPEIQVEAKPGAVTTVSFGLPDYITAYDPRANDYSSVKTTLVQGRDVTGP